MSDRLRSELAAYAAGRREIVSAYLFGSRLSGRIHADSDLDIGVVLDPALCPTAPGRAAVGVRINGEIIGVAHINAVDLVILNDAPPELGAMVVTEGARLYCRDSALDRRVAHRLIMRRADLKPFLARARQTLLDAVTGGAA